MLPALRTNQNLMLRTSRLTKAPWFEIWLFKTRLRFRNPKATAKVPAGIYAEPKDMRPFVNTESKKGYWNAEGLPSSLHIYSNRWSFSSRRWFAKSKAVLDFHLEACAVMECDKTQYSDLYQSDIGREWVAQWYRNRKHFWSQFTFTKLPCGDLEVQIDDAAPDPREDQEKVPAVGTPDNHFPVEILDLNGHVAYRIRPNANQLDFLVPFTSEDVLVFTFMLTSTEPLEENVRQAVLQKASQFANGIMQTVSLEYPDT